MASPAAIREPDRADHGHGTAVASGRAASREPALAPGFPGASGDATSEALDLLVAALDHRELRAAATAVVNRMASSLGARRVSLGTWNGSNVELIAVSGSA